MSKETILVVDDDSFIRDVLSDFLTKRKYHVLLAESGERALELLKPGSVHVALVDLKMPGMDGVETMEAIRKKDANVLIIIMTGYPSIESAVKALRNGAFDYVIKPFELDALVHTIERSLRRTHPESELHRYKQLVSLYKQFVSLLAEKNERLMKQLETRMDRTVAIKEAEKYRAICGAVAHSLKGEFLHIGYSIKELRESANTSPDMQEECDMIERSVGYSQILLRRLLDYVDIGKPQVEPIDALELLRKTELLARPRLPSSVKLQITIDHSMKERIVSANFEQLMGVLVELIDNAVRVLREKGGTIDLDLEGRNGEIAISVEDNGPGIPEEFKEKLLKEQVPSKNGLGLGLFLCNRVVSALGGKLSLENTSEEGTTFTILLPVASEEKEL